MEKTLLTLALALLCTVAVAQRPCTGSFNAEQSAVNWTAEWTTYPANGTISFTVMARTDGYVAIGFSEMPAMPNTDIIVGAVNSTANLSYVSDRYANARAPPLVDLSQDIFDATAEEVLIGNMTYTIVRFSRNIATVDPNDLSLDRMVRILYAWGTEVNFDPADPMSIQRHGPGPLNRGASDLISFVCPGPPPMPEFIPGDCTGSFMADGTRGGVNWNAMWTVSADSRSVRFTVMAQTAGWVAIGFSLDRAMPDTDVIVGAVDVAANFSYVSDRYAFARAPPRVDASQDIMNATAQEVMRDQTMYTVVTFTTPVTRTAPDDLSLNQRLYLLYAWGMEVNGNASDPMSINVHGGTGANRGISDTPISILCEATPAAVPDGAAVPVATASVVILALIALLATLL